MCLTQSLSKPILIWRHLGPKPSNIMEGQQYRKMGLAISSFTATSYVLLPTPPLLTLCCRYIFCLCYRPLIHRRRLSPSSSSLSPLSRDIWMAIIQITKQTQLPHLLAGNLHWIAPTISLGRRRRRHHHHHWSISIIITSHQHQHRWCMQQLHHPTTHILWWISIRTIWTTQACPYPSTLLPSFLRHTVLVVNHRHRQVYILIHLTQWHKKNANKQCTVLN